MKVGLRDIFFQSFVVDPLSGCWLWQKALVRGYGKIHASFPIRKMLSAHRLSWEIHNGPVPEGICVCHKCDVRQCVNPEHLFLGTTLDNMRDKVQKGRSARGQKQHLSKLTAEQVKEIRASSKSLKQLGHQFGVTKQSVWAIKKGQTWGWLQ